MSGGRIRGALIRTVQECRLEPKYEEANGSGFKSWTVQSIIQLLLLEDLSILKSDEHQGMGFWGIIASNKKHYVLINIATPNNSVVHGRSFQWKSFTTGRGRLQHQRR